VIHFIRPHRVSLVRGSKPLHFSPSAPLKIVIVYMSKMGARTLKLFDGIVHFYSSAVFPKAK